MSRATLPTMTVRDSYPRYSSRGRPIEANGRRSSIRRSRSPSSPSAFLRAASSSLMFSSRLRTFCRSSSIRIRSFSFGGALMARILAFGRNRSLRGAHDLAVARLPLFLELFGQFERFSPRIPQGGLSLSFRLFLHCSNLSLHLFDSLESFLFAHAERSGRTRLVFKGFRRVRNISECLHVACDSHFYMSLFMIPSRCNSRSPVTHEKSIHLDAILRRKNAVVHNV